MWVAFEVLLCVLMMDANVPKKLIMYLVDKLGIQEGKFFVWTVIKCRGVIYAMSSVFFFDKITSLGDQEKVGYKSYEGFFFFWKNLHKVFSLIFQFFIGAEVVIIHKTI
jgi:hypothetical protein